MRRKRSDDNIAFRRTAFLDDEQRPDDYEVRYNGRTAGCTYRLRSTGRELWQSKQGRMTQPIHGPNGGVADSLVEARAAFRAAGERPGRSRPVEECSETQ